MITSRMNPPRHRSCRKHGLPTAAVVRSSQATPAAVDKSLSASHKKILTPPCAHIGVEHLAASNNKFASHGTNQAQ